MNCWFHEVRATFGAQVCHLKRVDLDYSFRMSGTLFNELQEKHRLA